MKGSRGRRGPPKEWMKVRLPPEDKRIVRLDHATIKRWKPGKNMGVIPHNEIAGNEHLRRFVDLMRCSKEFQAALFVPKPPMHKVGGRIVSGKKNFLLKIVQPMGKESVSIEVLAVGGAPGDKQAVRYMKRDELWLIGHVKVAIKQRMRAYNEILQKLSKRSNTADVSTSREGRFRLELDALGRLEVASLTTATVDGEVKEIPDRKLEFTEIFSILYDLNRHLSEGPTRRRRPRG